MITRDALVRGNILNYAGGTAITPQPVKVVVVNCDGVDVWYCHQHSKFIQQTPVERFLEIVNGGTAPEPDPFPRDNFERYMRELRALGYRVEVNAYDPESGIGEILIKPPASPESLLSNG